MQGVCHRSAYNLTTDNSDGEDQLLSKRISLQIVNAETEEEVVTGTIWITMAYLALFWMAAILAMCGVPIAAKYGNIVQTFQSQWIL